jgi:ABC-type branched-subunit amino acid transport system ATPase component
MNENILSVRNLSKSFGAVRALDNVDFFVGKGELCGLIGPNGSGKTTFFDCCTGLVAKDYGNVLLDGIDITNWSLHRIALQGGLVRSFQRNVVLGSMTVEENLLVAGQMHAFPGILSTFLKGPKTKARVKELHLRCSRLIELVGLEQLRNTLASELSVGQQKLLQFASVMMPSPRVVLMDEPLSGVNPVLVERLSRNIQQVNRETGTTFIIIEHNIQAIMDLCPRIVVFNAGQKIADGPPEEVFYNSKVREAYLGN